MLMFKVIILFKILVCYNITGVLHHHGMWSIQLRT
jgi:hypothetical protein